jgi:hypothetical protein
MRYSIFSTDIATDIDLIERIKALIYSRDTVEDFFIFTDEVVGLLYDHSSLPTFYTIAYRGTTIFLNIHDYFEFKDKLIGPLAIYLNKETLDFIDRNTIRGCSIIAESDNQLIWIPNYGL